MGFVGLLKFAVKCLDVLAWPVFGLGYPLCASIQAIETNSNSDTQKLITYWVSISVVLLFEHAFQLEWLAFWPYMKLMIVGCLVLPYFDGSLYVYKHFVHPCLSMDPRIITCQFNKLEELFFKKDDFFVEVKRYIKENGSDALEDLIASTKKSAKPNVAVNKIRAAAVDDWPKFEQTKLPVRFKDSNAVEIKEKIEVASTEQLKFEQPKLPVRFKDSNAVEITEKKELASTAQIKIEQPKLPVRFKDGNAVGITEKKKLHQPCSSAVEITEKKEVASTKQVRQIESNNGQTENITFLPLENINTATTKIGGRDPYEVLPPEKAQKIWTCAICQVTAQSEAVLNSHLQGNRHRAACEQLKVKNQTPKSEDSPASVGKKSNFTTATAGTGFSCVVCQLTLESLAVLKSHLQGKRHKKAFELLNSKNQASNNNVNVSPPSMGKTTNFPESKPEKCTISNTTSPENRMHESKKQGKQENLMKSLSVEIRNSKWWCTICNVSCTSEGNMHSHLNGNKHLARMRELGGLGKNEHA
ncbi:unnamed protein product [Dovyalis caffra]|uniref:HVA22-like protein n=1 Tax=Dovyalis caffra TaxID=77055 RepID=A0AAV1R8M9_9ROSI|nr:unnamed protein product [Dovyalis caffra]